MNKRIATLVAVATVWGCVHDASADTFGAGANSFNMDFVSIPSSTNPGSGVGIVNNDYRMGTFEVTNDQWNKFKNSLGVAVTGSPAVAYDGNPSGVGPNLGASNSSWFEAAQFINWLNTSKGFQAAYKFTGTQGQPDYTLSKWSPAEADNGTNLYRNKDAVYYMPTDDEWVKAAYWNGTNLQTYATLGDVVPVETTDTNYLVTTFGPLWDVGTGSEELNGTFDMMGNLYEWTETPTSDPNFGDLAGRTMRGGSFSFGVDRLRSSFAWNDINPFGDFFDFGFRVASEVPEPSSLVLLSFAGMTLLRRRRR